MIRHATLWLLVWRCWAVVMPHCGYWYGGAGLTRVRHDAEAWVPVAGCGMVLHGAENRKAVSLIITLYFAVVQGLAGLYKKCVPKVRSCSDRTPGAA